MDNVKLNWRTESSANKARAAIRYGDVGQDKTVNLVIKNESILNMSEAVGSGIVYATTGFNTNTAIAVLDSEIIPYAGQYAYKGNSGDFQAVAYAAGRAYMSFEDAVDVAEQSAEDVTLELLRDVDITSANLTIEHVNGQNIIWDGNGHKVTVSKAILLYQYSGLLEIKNLNVAQSGGNPLFRIGNKDATYSEKVTVNLTDITVDSEGTCQSGLIQAGYATMSLDVNMTNVIIDWDNTTKPSTTGAIVAGKSDKTTTLNLTMTDCNIDASGSQDATGIYTESTVKGNLILKNTSITSYTGKDAVVDQNMKFARNTASVLSTYPAKQVQVGDFVYNEFMEGVADANVSEEDVTIKLLSDVDIASDHLRLQNVNNKNIVWDGNGFTANISKAIFIYQKAGSVDVKNMIIKQSAGNPLFRIGELGGTYPTSAEEVFTVNLIDLNIDAEGPCTDGLIQAGYGSMKVAVNMKNVDFAWETTNTSAKNIIVAGADNKTTVLDLNIEDCTFDTTNVSATKAIHAKDGVTGTITFKNSTVKTKEADVIRLGNMDLAIDTATTFWQGKTQSIALVDGVQKSDFYAAVTLVNSATANTRMDIVNNFIHNDSNGVTINNANGKDVLVDGHGHTADVRRAILIYQTSGLVDIRNLPIELTGGNPLFRIGKADGEYSLTDAFTVNLTDITINTTSSCKAGLIQAGFGTMKAAVNMKGVNVTWTKDETVNYGDVDRYVIVAGNSGKTPVVDLTLDSCIIDTTQMSRIKPIQAVDGATGTIAFKSSTIKTQGSNVIRQGDMDLVIDNATTFWQGETQSVALVDGVQKSDFYAAVTLVNSATANTRMDIVNNFIHNNSDGVTINNANGNNVLVDGHGHTADVRRAILIYQKSGSMDIKNFDIDQTGGNPLFRIGELQGTYPTEGVFTVNFTNLDIDSEGTAGALIQAGYGSMKVIVNMKNVDFAWETTNTNAKNIIVAGADNKTTELDLNIENCTFDTTNVSATKFIHAQDGATGTITLKNSTVKTQGADVIKPGNMDLVIDSATTFWQDEIQSTAFIDGVQYTQLSDAVTAANSSEEDETIILVADEVTYSGTVDINNVNGKNITIDGRNKNLYPNNGALRIYQKSGLVELKNLVVPDLNQNIFVRIGDRGSIYENKLTVNLENITVNSTSTQSKGIIQAGYGVMSLDLNMTDVEVTWAPTGEHSKGAMTVGNGDVAGVATVNITMTDCAIDTSGAKDGHAIYVENNATGTIQLHNTSLIAADGRTVYNNNIPVYDTDKVTKILYKDSDFYEVCIEGADATDLSTYATTLGNQGYTKHSEKTIGNAEYAAYSNDELAIYINQFDSTMRIKADDKENTILPTTQQPSFTKVCETKGYMVGVTAGTTTLGYTNENGMCFIYLLADGTFLIYDGGRNEDDAKHLYTLLQSIAKNNGISNIVISNWIVTHAHGDHMGCMESFFSQYASQVTIERVMLNKTHVSLGTATSESLEKKVVNAVNTYSADTKIVRLHSGQDFYLADVKVEVLYTIEDLALGTFTDFNAASTITRLTIGDKTILMTGDASPEVWDLLCATQESALQSDYLQVPHHGAENGGTTDAYDKIKPTYLLWPCGDSLYERNLNILFNEDYLVNKHLIDMVETENSYIAGVYDATNSKERITEFPFSE